MKFTYTAGSEFGSLQKGLLAVQVCLCPHPPFRSACTRSSPIVFTPIFGSWRQEIEQRPSEKKANRPVKKKKRRLQTKKRGRHLFAEKKR
jgi:hypothetical protein